MEQDKPQHATPPTRNLAARALTRIAHVYFALARGMTMGVRAACFDEAGRVFLVRHSYVPGWHLPGGGIERGETALDAIIANATTPMIACDDTCSVPPTNVPVSEVKKPITENAPAVATPRPS